MEKDLSAEKRLAISLALGAGIKGTQKALATYSMETLPGDILLRDGLTAPAASNGVLHILASRAKA